MSVQKPAEIHKRKIPTASFLFSLILRKEEIPITKQKVDREISRTSNKYHILLLSKNFVLALGGAWARAGSGRNLPGPGS